MGVLTKEMADVLIEIWAACGRVKSLPPIWHNVLVFPIYEKGDRSEAESYRPITLLSHARKAIEKAIDGAIKDTVNFNPLQCGFLEKSVLWKNPYFAGIDTTT